MKEVRHQYRYPYKAREAFLDFHKREQRWAVLVCHRRAGKTVATIADIIRRAIHEKKPGDFKVQLQLNRTLGDAQLRLLDAQGRLVKVHNATLKQGENTVSFEGLQLPKGFYQLMVETEAGAMALKVVVQ